jgi:hypothetical protein
MFRDLLPDTTGRVEQHTDRKINEEIRDRMIAAAFDYAKRSEAEISVRIKQLDREWDTERLLEVTTGLLALGGIALGFALHIGWFIVAGLAALFLLQHALQGWCPVLPIIRKLGFRTPHEIHEEKTALRILRGDLDHLQSSSRRMASRYMH